MSRRVNPLHRGAGQFPTIGRAALFGTFIEGIAPAVRDIREAVGKLANSGEDLQALGGRPPKGVDVFVAFSVAGGTGAGIFYDYLHLIARDVPAAAALRVKIYPLVLMPSAFEEAWAAGGPPSSTRAGRCSTCSAWSTSRTAPTPSASCAARTTSSRSTPRSVAVTTRGTSGSS